MALETATYINDLDAANPVGGTDIPNLGDEHLRLLKAAIKRTFPNIAGPVTVTPAQLHAIGDGMRRDVNLRVSATHSYSARPQFSRSGVAYNMGGHYGIAIDTSGTVISPALAGWSATLVAKTYFVNTPPAPQIGPAFGTSDLPRMAAVATPGVAGLRAITRPVQLTNARGQFSYLLLAADDTTTVGPVSVLVNAW